MNNRCNSVKLGIKTQRMLLTDSPLVHMAVRTWDHCSCRSRPVGKGFYWGHPCKGVTCATVISTAASLIASSLALSALPYLRTHLTHHESLENDVWEIQIYKNLPLTLKHFCLDKVVYASHGSKTHADFKSGEAGYFKVFSLPSRRFKKKCF
jgi:hypothetical protein